MRCLTGVAALALLLLVAPSAADQTASQRRLQASNDCPYNQVPGLFGFGCVCAAGWESAGSGCAPCKPGTHKASSGNHHSCVPCRQGFAQPEAGQSTCSRCAGGESNHAKTACIGDIYQIHSSVAAVEVKARSALDSTTAADSICSAAPAGDGCFTGGCPQEAGECCSVDKFGTIGETGSGCCEFGADTFGAVICNGVTFDIGRATDVNGLVTYSITQLTTGDLLNALTKAGDRYIKCLYPGGESGPVTIQTPCDGDSPAEASHITICAAAKPAPQTCDCSQCGVGSPKPTGSAKGFQPNTPTADSSPSEPTPAAPVPTGSAKGLQPDTPTAESSPSEPTPAAPVPTGQAKGLQPDSPTPAPSPNYIAPTPSGSDTPTPDVTTPTAPTPNTTPTAPTPNTTPTAPTPNTTPTAPTPNTTPTAPTPNTTPTAPTPNTTPTAVPTPSGSDSPTPAPSGVSPTAVPTPSNDDSPTPAPSGLTPTAVPTPSGSDSPTPAPSGVTPTAVPTPSNDDSPTPAPSGYDVPTATPTQAPSSGPQVPTTTPTAQPTAVPTPAAPETPTESPSATPTQAPSSGPQVPTTTPTLQPTAEPTYAPPDTPTESPSATPTQAPSSGPQVPTTTPTAQPTAVPTPAAPETPTESPTAEPTAAPTDAPTAAPTEAPTSAPTPYECPYGPPVCDKEPSCECRGGKNLPTPYSAADYFNPYSRCEPETEEIGARFDGFIEVGPGEAGDYTFHLGSTNGAATLYVDGSVLLTNDGSEGIKSDTLYLFEGLIPISVEYASPNNSGDIGVTLQWSGEHCCGGYGGSCPIPKARLCRCPTPPPTAAPTGAPTDAPTDAPTEAPTAEPTPSTPDCPYEGPQDYDGWYGSCPDDGYGSYDYGSCSISSDGAVGPLGDGCCKFDGTPGGKVNCNGAGYLIEPVAGGYSITPSKVGRYDTPTSLTAASLTLYNGHYLSKTPSYGGCGPIVIPEPCDDIKFYTICPLTDGYGDSAGDCGPPTPAPTARPTKAPTEAPTAVPTPSGGDTPTAEPTTSYGDVPTEEPTAEPTPSYGDAPTEEPTAEPTPSYGDVPTEEPTSEPTPEYETPTDAPTAEPTPTYPDEPTPDYFPEEPTPDYLPEEPTPDYLPPDDYNPPNDSYDPPSDSYDPPSDSYDPPSDSYNPPSDSYGGDAPTKKPAKHRRSRRNGRGY